MDNGEQQNDALPGECPYNSLATARTPPASPIHQNSGGVCSNYSTRRNSASNLCECRSALEEEAINAVREFAFALQTICISEMLPRTAELLFLNITTLEGATYCIELTEKGWRIASHRQDCMNGDFRRLDTHTRYFESLSQLLDTLSPLYREQFGSHLISRLNELKQSVDGVA